MTINASGCLPAIVAAGGMAVSAGNVSGIRLGFASTCVGSALPAGVTCGARVAAGCKAVGGSNIESNYTIPSSKIHCKICVTFCTLQNLHGIIIVYRKKIKKSISDFRFFVD